jgi:hypothetical protein
VPNAVDLDPATDVKSTNKALFTRSEIAVGVAFSQYTPCNNYISGVKISGYFA